MSAILDRLNGDLALAQKARDGVAVSTLRFLISGLHNAAIANGQELTEEELVAGIGKEAKKHKESIDAFGKAGRTDLVDKETKELEVLQRYLPAMLTDEELEKKVDEAIASVGATTAADFGKVMSIVLSGAGPSVDGATVSAIVRRKLGT